MDLIFAIQVNDREFLSVEWTPSRPKRRASMLRKTMIDLAKAAALTSGLTVEAFAHGCSAAAVELGWTKNMFKNIF